MLCVWPWPSSICHLFLRINTLVPSLIAFLSGSSRKHGMIKLLPHRVWLHKLHIPERAKGFPWNPPPPHIIANIQCECQEGRSRSGSYGADRSLLKLASRGLRPHSIPAAGPFTCLRLQWKGSSLVPPRGHLRSEGFARERVGKKLWFEQCFAWF